MNRRTFLTTPAAIAATPKPAHSGGKSPMFFGRWGVPIKTLVHARGNRYHLAVADGHDGPVVIFTRGHIPALGDPVIVHINADTCLRRGFGVHRHRTKMVLRVKAYDGELRPEQGTLTVVQTDPCIDRAYRIAGDWWLVDDGGEPREKYEPPFTDEEADLGMVAMPLPPTWRQLMADDDDLCAVPLPAPPEWK